MLFYLLVPVLLLRLLIRSRTNVAYRKRWGERFGWVVNEAEDQRTICLHAVSVGEVMAARPLIECLLAELPDDRLWVTTTTPTGSDTVKRLFGGRVAHSYLAYDTPGAVSRFIRTVDPSVFLVVETELWPNLYAACHHKNIPLLLLNARLSLRSVRRYHKIKGLVSETLGYTRRIMARGHADASHFVQLGADASQVEVAGNIKFDVPVDKALTENAAGLRRQFGQRMIWCAGSTHDGEEAHLLKTHKRLLAQFPDLLLILVPRHPERFEAVASLCEQQGVKYSRRSHQPIPGTGDQVFLGDSMGELLLWYALSDFVFVGGSLVPVGGHNPLEAMVFGVPVLSGGYIYNFSDLYPLLTQTGCARLVETSAELHDHAQYWLTHVDDRLSSGEAGRQFLLENKGVVGRLMTAIKTCLPDQ